MGLVMETTKVLLLAVLASACRSAVAAPPDGATPPARTPAPIPFGPSTVVQMTRTVCYGECPVYSVAIRGDGRVFYYGHEYTGTKGYAERRIEPSKVQDLVEFMRKRQYRSLPNVFLAKATDHPSAITSLRQGTLFYRIQHDLSNKDSRALFEIEQEIDNVAGTKPWISTHELPPEKPLGTAELRTMSGDALGGVERRCATKPPSEVKVRGSLDEDGRLETLELSGGSTEASRTCVSKALSSIVFPLAYVPKLEFVLSLRGAAAP